MRRDVGGVLLILVGGTLLRLAGSDAYLLYVRATMRPYLLVSGAILLVLGVGLVVDVLRGSRRAPAAAAPGTHEHDDGHAHDGHGHDHGRSALAAWLLVLPVLAVFLVAPPALGAYTAARSVAVVQPPPIPAVPALPPGDPVTTTLQDYAVRAVWDDGRTLTGRTIHLVGFVTPGQDGAWYLTRLTLTCCAADAVTTKILVVDPPSNPAANTWLDVTGTWVPGGGTQSATAIPWLKISTMKQIPQPKDPYE